MANNTDDIATQLAVLKYVKIFDIDGAVADMAQESAIEGVVEQERAKAAERAVAQEVQSEAEAVPVSDEAFAAAEARAVEGETKYSIANTQNMSWEDQLRKSKRSDTLVASKNTPSYLTERGVSDKPLAIPKSIITKAQSGKDESHSISDDNVKKLSYGIENAIAVVDDRDRNSLFYITNLNENGKPITVAFAKDMDFDGDKVHAARSIHIREDIGAYLNGLNNATIYVKNKNEFDNLSRNADNLDRVQEKIELIDKSISQPEPIVNTSGKKNITKHDLAESGNDGKAAEKSSESKNKSAESKKAEAKSGEPKINKAKESLTDEQRKENARKRAEQMIEYEKANAPTAKELNTVREYVKGFDNLSKPRKASIVRMIRSADGKVDKKILKGLANLMAITPKADVEIRFAEGIGNGGLYTHVGNKALIILDSSANYKATIQGTIAHELVHYIENKAGYKDFADYVMKRVKPERRAEVEKLYNEHCTEVYTAEAKKQGLDAEGIKKYVAEKMATEEHKDRIESEVVAKYVGQALNNEKLLKKYADKDKKFIARVGEWLLKKATSLRKKKDADSKLDIDEELIKIADEMAFRVSVLMQETSTTGESKSGTRYAFDEPPEQIAEWKKPITIHDINRLRAISDMKGEVSVNDLTSDELKTLQKWAFKYWNDPKIKEKSPFFRAWFGEWRSHQTKEFISIATIPEYIATNEARRQNRGTVTNTDTGWNIRISREGEGNTISHSGAGKLSEYGLAGIRELIANAYLFDTEIHEHHNNNAKDDRIAFNHKLYALGRNKNNILGLYRITVEETFRNEKDPHDMRFHNLKYIEKVADDVGSLTHNNYGAETTSDVSTTIYSIADLYGFVKTFDKEFSPAPEVSQYVLNEDGTPKVFYHGTRKENGEFWEFDYNKAKKKGGLGFKALGHGNYFTSTKLDGTELYGSRVIPAYLSLKNPMIVESGAGFDFRTKVSETLGINAQHMTYPSIQMSMKNHGFDGVIQVDKNGNVAIAVAFDSTQIKSATENIGTFDKSNPDIRYDLDESNVKKSKAKTKAEVIAENRELKAENQELKASQNKMRGMLEKLAREEAEYQKRANAEVFDKKDVDLAVSSIEGWTQEEALSLAKGFVFLSYSSTPIKQKIILKALAKQKNL